ncbi:hypothetical protein EG328_002880 [Venturia inaequalis]|uniref:Uncharacterized protein n=1 Tax=Venturia inaequalis TaxID=5025 RepID=A0A8H3VMP8_VENIN|nr:hypothetical protein EG328_002880 [Venturia inaequalis]KAE9990247.1 hypothetical protein EG327_001630 [Venturia inaequalis]
MSTSPNRRSESETSERSWTDGEKTFVGEEETQRSLNEKKRRLVIDVRVAYLTLMFPERTRDGLHDQAQAEYEEFAAKSDDPEGKWSPASFHDETVGLQQAALETSQGRIWTLEEQAGRDREAILELYRELEAARDWIEEFSKGGREQDIVITKLKEALRVTREENSKLEMEDGRLKRVIVKLEKRLRTRAEEDGRFNVESLVDERPREVVVEYRDLPVVEQREDLIVQQPVRSFEDKTNFERLRETFDKQTRGALIKQLENSVGNPFVNQLSAISKKSTLESPLAKQMEKMDFEDPEIKLPNEILDAIVADQPEGLKVEGSEGMDVITDMKINTRNTKNMEGTTDDAISSGDTVSNEAPASKQDVVSEKDAISKQKISLKKRITTEKHLISKGDTSSEEDASTKAEDTGLETTKHQKMTPEQEDALFEAEFRHKATKLKARGWWDDTKVENEHVECTAAEDPKLTAQEDTLKAEAASNRN